MARHWVALLAVFLFQSESIHALTCLEAAKTIVLAELPEKSPLKAGLPLRSPIHTPLTPETRAQYERYLRDSYEGHERMRGKNGLIQDTVYLEQDGKGGFKVIDAK